MTATDQLRRLLAVLPRLADGQEHRIEDVASMVGVDAATIERDLFELSERAGDPPGWIETVTLFFQGERVSMQAPSHFKRPMRLTAPEARALELGLAMLRAEGREDVEGTIERIRALVSPEESAEVPRSVSVGRRNSLTHVAALRDAMRNRKRVRIQYHKGAGSQPDERTICPFSFAVEKGVWYLVAYCDRSQGVRIFRTDRIEHIELLQEGFKRPADLDVDTILAERSAFVGQPAEKLTVRYSARAARWVAEREEGRAGKDGSLEVDYPLADEEWAIRHVLQYGADAEVIAPAGLRETVVRRLKAALQ